MATQPQSSQFAKGLDGVVAAQTRLSKVLGSEGRLSYCGYRIEDLAAHATFEEVCHLLWEQRLPNKTELAALRKELASYRELPKPVYDLLKAFPRDAHTMHAVRSAVSALGAFDPDSEDASPEANRRKARRLTAQMATIVAAWEHIRNGRKPVKVDAKLSHAAGFLHQLTGKKPTAAEERVMDVALTLHAEHGMNASTFAARVTCATMSDMHSAITSAVGALKGPLHGGANQLVMEMLLKIGDVEGVAPYLRQALAEKRKIPGFGHRVYKTTDPRAPLLSALAESVGRASSETRWFEITQAVQAFMLEERRLYPNVDLYSASTFYAMKIQPDLFSAVFAVARVAGWTAHVVEQLADNRLMRPQAEYIGVPDRAWVPMESR